jgi:hypothetical protein
LISARRNREATASGAIEASPETGFVVEVGLIVVGVTEARIAAGANVAGVDVAVVRIGGVAIDGMLEERSWVFVPHEDTIGNKMKAVTTVHLGMSVYSPTDRFKRRTKSSLRLANVECE